MGRVKTYPTKGGGKLWEKRREMDRENTEVEGKRESRPRELGATSGFERRKGFGR